MKILNVFEIRDQNFAQKYGISTEKIYLVTTLRIIWLDFIVGFSSTVPPENIYPFPAFSPRGLHASLPR